MKIKICTLLLLLPIFVAFSQDKNYTKQIISSLSSDKLNGRGFEYKGDVLAARFLSKELEKIGVNPFGKKYLQPFKIPINTFPGTISVSIDEKKLKNGEEFLVDKMSISAKGTFNLVWLDDITVSGAMNKDLSNSYVVIDTAAISEKKLKDGFTYVKYLNPFKAAGIIEVIDKKASSYQSQVAGNCPVIQIHRDAINKKQKKISLIIESKFNSKYKTNNVIGYISGEIDSFIIIGGHYDHLGRMDDIIFPGANDNCSGVAMSMDLAKHFAKPKNKPKYSMLFVFFSAEEVGLLGSDFFTNNPPVPLTKMKFMINLDMVGTGDDGITIVNGGVLKKEFSIFKDQNEENSYLPEVKPRGEAANSDHHFFYARGVKSFFIYTRGGVSEYHNIDDIAKTLPLTGYDGLFRLILDFITLYE